MNNNNNQASQLVSAATDKFTNTFKLFAPAEGTKKVELYSRDFFALCGLGMEDIF